MLEYWCDPAYSLQAQQSSNVYMMYIYTSQYMACCITYHIIAEYFSGLHKSCYIGREHTLLHQNVSVDSQVLFSDESMIGNSIPQWEWLRQPAEALQ